MKLQRTNKYKGRVAGLVASLLAASVILSGCDDTKEEVISTIQTEIPAVIETVIPTVKATTKPVVETETPAETLEPTPIPTLEVTPEPIPELTPEPTPEIPEFCRSRMEFNHDVSLDEFTTLVYKDSEGDIKIIPVVVEMLKVDDFWVSNYYDIYSGSLVYSCVMGYNMNDDFKCNIYKENYVNSALDKCKVIDVVDIYMYLFYREDDYFTEEEGRIFRVEFAQYNVDGASWDDVFYPIEEYRAFYEEAIPDRYKVDSYEMFPVEDAKVLTKNG